MEPPPKPHKYTHATDVWSSRHQVLVDEKKKRDAELKVPAQPRSPKWSRWQPPVPVTGHTDKTLKNGECHPCRDGRKLLPADKPAEPNAEEEPAT